MSLLWVDKHRPKDFEGFLVHKDLSTRLKRVVTEGDFPNLLFHGPSGAGKKTLIMCLLREVFGNRVENLRIQNKDIDIGTSSRRMITITTLQSPFHIEVNPSDSGSYDRHVVTKLIKEIAQSIPVNIDITKRRQQGFKVVIVNESDYLTHSAQSALRRTMEKYTKNCKVILVCTSISKILEPIRSRCFCIRVPSPTKDEMKQVLTTVGNLEKIRIPVALMNSLIDRSEGNMRRSILNLESEKVRRYPFAENQTVGLPEWDKYIREIALSMITAQHPKRLLEIRGKFYTLLTNCIPGDMIFRRLLFHILKQKMNSDLKLKVVHFAGEFEHRMKNGTKPIFHLEAFTIRFMKEYKDMK